MYNQKLLNQTYNFIESEKLYCFDEDSFTDKLLDFLGTRFKKLGSKIFEYLKRKYMIGKYSRNLRQKFSYFKKAQQYYINVIVPLADLISTGNFDKDVYNGYIKACNKLNTYCRRFIDVLPELNYYNPVDATYNYSEIKNYMNLFKRQLR